jgi:hypothetical protein
MPRLSVAVVAVAVGFSTTAFAQNLTAAQRTAREADHDKYCTGTMPGGGRIIAYLDKQRDSLGAACRKVLDAREQ